MNTTQYLFQSPYNTQVQFGRPDPSSEQNQKLQSDTNKLNQQTNSTAKEASNFQTNQTSEVKPTVSSSNLLDIYA
jgi:hypothetical protein